MARKRWRSRPDERTRTAVAHARIYSGCSAVGPAGLPVAVALIAIFFFFMTPVLNTITRTLEAQADIFGLNTARQPDGFATVTLKLSEYRKLDPSPWEERIFYDHPGGRTRIYTAMRWKAENDAATARTQQDR